MKTRITVIYSLIVALMLVITACDPIVDEQHLTNSTTVDGVELIATQSTPGGNKITLEMVTPGITGYWNYNLGKALTNKVEIVYPIPGNNTFTYVGTLGGEFFEKTIEVQIDQLDTPLDQDWYDLVSDNTAAGKTWVFKGGPSPDGQLWWYMSPPGDPGGWASVWWNAAGDCCPPADAAGKMTFDLDGGANFTRYADASGTPTSSGSFVLDVTNRTLQINDANILGAGTEGECGYTPAASFSIISLTEDELILYTPSAAGCGTGWTWIFVPEE